LDNDAEYITHEDVAAVARTGSYNDLEDKPECIEKEVIGRTVVAHAQAIYDGIEVYAFPRSASGVESDIIVTESNLKTINGQSIVGSGDLTISGGGSYDDSEIRETISQLSAMTDDFNSDIANLYKIKQDTLVSGTNIKTINGESILGSGDIEISGGSGGGGKEYVEAPLLTEPLGTSIMFTTSVPLEPNKVYVAKKKVSSINVERMLMPSDSIGAEYTIMFQTSTSELPIIVGSYASLLWANGAIPTIEADTYYELSLVLNNINNTNIIKAVLTPFKPVE
jgi:hypothetical protein